MQEGKLRSGAPSRRLGRLRSQLLGLPAPTAAGPPSQYNEHTEALEQYRQRLAQGASAFQPPSDEVWEAYRDGAVKRAMELGNRGPMRFDADGNLTPEIQEAYWRCGFYVFENVVSPEEIAETRAEFEELLENAPVEKGSKVDKHGRQVRFPQGYEFVVPHRRGEVGAANTHTNVVNDAQKEGGPPTAAAGPATAAAPTTAGTSPSAEKPYQRTPELVGSIIHPMVMMPTVLRLYGHPDILKANACLNGFDFTPMEGTPAILNKAPGEGQATQWHQDGRTHWNTETGRPGRQDGKLPPRQPGAVYPEDLGPHGNSFHVAVTNCLPDQCMWVVPFSHNELFWPHWRNGKFEVGPGSQGIHLVQGAFTSGEIEMLPNAVPMLMHPGDVGIHNRSCVHGAFPNMSPERRLTLVLAYYNRRYVVDAKARRVMGEKEAERLIAEGKQVIRRKLVMDEAHIRDKSRIIQVAIDSRKERYPNETPYVYRPLIGEPMPPREEFVRDYSHSFSLDL